MSQPNPPAPRQEPSFLARRIGPFPVLVWIIGIAVAIGLWYWWKNRSSSSSTDTSAASTYTGQTGFNAGNYTTTNDGGSWYQATNPSGTTSDTPGTSTTTSDTPVVQVPTNNRTTSITYPVKSGDTLTAIAARFGIGVSPLYTANASLIESTAKSHGFSSSGNGHWIFPGEQLVIPL
jgi:LysM repeat protein